MLEAKSQEERNVNAAAAKLTSRSELYGEQLAPKLDAKKLEAAVARQKAFEAAPVETDDKKRGYNSFASTDVTPEDMEAYRMAKANDFNDPMAKFKKAKRDKGEEGSDEEEKLLDYDEEVEKAKRKKR